MTEYSSGFLFSWTAEHSHCLLSLSLLIYAISASALPIEIDQFFRTNYMGYGSFATIWIVYFSIATFIAKLCYLYTSEAKTPRSLPHILKFVSKCAFEFLFPLSLSYSFIITIGYWPILFINYENFYPKFKNDAKIPLFTDLCYHLLPLVSLLGFWSQFSESLMNVVFITLTGLIYQLLTNYSFLKTGMWPYPFMNGFTMIGANLMILAGVLATIIVFLVLRKLKQIL